METKMKFSAKRYFIVFYTAKNVGGGFTVGESYIVTDGGFIDRTQTVTGIAALNPTFAKVVLTSILEVSKSDMDDYNIENPPTNSNQPNP